jgi:hypothetical protein
MTTLPQWMLANLRHQAENGHDDARVLLHLIARADAQDQWFTRFTDHYAKTIAALCRRLEALERGAKDLPTPAAPVDAGPVADALLVAESALNAEPQGEKPSEKDLYDLAAEFNGDPVPAMRRALEVWGNPLQGAPAPGENPATHPAPVPETPAEVFNLIARMADELDRLQPLPAFPPITSHPLAIEARALLRRGSTIIPLPQAGKVEA